MSERQNGTVKWFDDMKGYGMITPDTGGDDVFVHLTAVKNSGLKALMPGQNLSFAIVHEKNRIQAGELRIEE
ncbi:cold shock protein [Fusarium avenaceum]|nr:cold shock protein [Fusarium avenaceum]